MKKLVIQSLGIFLFLIGLGFMLNSLSNITGYTIFVQFDAENSSFYSVILIIGGLTLFIAGRGQESSDLIIVNKKKGIKKIKFALLTRSINYNKLRMIVKESGYKFIEGKDYAAVFSPREEIIKNQYGYPIVIPYDKKNNKELLLKILKAIIEDYQEFN